MAAMTNSAKGCRHLKIYFEPSNCAEGVCLTCNIAVKRSEAFIDPTVTCTLSGDNEALEAAATLKDAITLLHAIVDFSMQESELLRTALAAQIALTNLEREVEKTAHEFFFAQTRLNLRINAALKHANELAVDRVEICQKLESL